MLYQSILPAVHGDCVPRKNMNPYGPDLPPSLKMMIDIASAEAEINQRHMQLAHQQRLEQGQGYPPNPFVAHTHRYAPQSNAYHNQHSPYATASYNSYHQFSSGLNHNNISPTLNGTTLTHSLPRTMESSNSTSVASTPSYSKPSSPRSEYMHSSPKIQCSLCLSHVDISQSLACTECIHGFCQACIIANTAGDSNESCDGISSLSKMKLEASPVLEARDAEPKRRALSRSKKQAPQCGVCGVVGARYKPVRLIVRV